MTEQERNQLIARKLGEGMSLSDLQELLSQEYGVQMTYLDLRLLAADLQVDWQAHEKSRPATPGKAPAAEAEDEADAEPEGPEELGAPHGRTVVTVSKLVRPGAAMSGEVTFASGAKGEWFLDGMGRLGLNPTPGSSRPTQEDIRDFQIELQRKLTGGP